MHRIKIIFFFISLIVLVPCALIFAEESISITTYYPSPYGVYNEMRLYPHATPITSCDTTTEGTMFYNSTAHELQVCNGSGVWKSGGGFWAGSGDDIYNTNTGNVGIGTANPVARLQISPNITNNFPRPLYVRSDGTEDATLHPLAVMNNINRGLCLGAEKGETFASIDAKEFVNGNGVNNIDLVINRDGGNVGIGTLAPEAKLHVWSQDVYTEIKAENSNPNLGADLHLKADVAEYSIVVHGSNDGVSPNTFMIVREAGVKKRFVIADSGNVGIGTAAPQTQLHVKGDDGTRGLLVEGTSVADAVTENAVIFIQPKRVNAEGNLVFVDSAGRKKSLIHTDDTAGTIAMQFQAFGDGATYGTIDFTQFLGPGPNAFPTGTGNGAGGQSRLFINSAGNIGLGTIFPGINKLYVNGRAYASGGWQTTASDYAEWFEKEGNSIAGDIIGINLATGKARKYQIGDELIGVYSSKPGVVGNKFKETDEEMRETCILVGLVGQLDFEPSQVIVENRIVKTKDGKKIGVLLSNGKVLVGR